MNYEDNMQPPYLDLAAPHCHTQLPVLSAIGRGPKGDKGDKGNPGPYSRFDFETVADMIAESSLEPGDICHTLGFHEADDGGAAWYEIVDDGEPNGMDVLDLNNGRIAKLKMTNKCLTPEMFSAYGNGIDNDFNAFERCAVFANANNCIISVPRKDYYVNGNHSIELKCDFICEGSTFIVGNSHRGYQNAVFIYNHDSEIASIQGKLGDFLVDNNTVTDAYKNKFFLLDTRIAYGTPISPTAVQDETIKEVVYSRDTFTEIYFTKDISSYLTRNVVVNNVSNIDEFGYVFKGCTVTQKDSTGKGITFLIVQRHNMTVEDIQIKCDNTLAENNVLKARYCNDVLFKNIRSYTKQPYIWGYEISLERCSNAVVDNFKAGNYWSSIANNTLKNYSLLNSRTTTFDCHWNAFGDFICENCTLLKDAHIGYGNGRFIIKNTKCNFIALRYDYLQTWSGKIIIEDVTTVDGLRMYFNDDENLSGYDSFFNELYLPEVHLTRFYGSKHFIYIRMNPDKSGRFNTKNLMFINECMIDSIVSVPYEKVIYDVALRAIPHYIGMRSEIKKFGNIVFDDYYKYELNIDLTDKFSDYNNTSYIKDGIVFLSFYGTAKQDINALIPIEYLPLEARPSPDKNLRSVVQLNSSDNTMFYIHGASGAIEFTKKINQGDFVCVSTSYPGTGNFKTNP